MGVLHLEKIIRLSTLLLDAKLVKSKSEAKRLIKAGAVKIDGKKVTMDLVRLVMENEDQSTATD